MNKFSKDARPPGPRIPRKPIIIWVFLIVTALVVAQLHLSNVRGVYKPTVEELIKDSKLGNLYTEGRHVPKQKGNTLRGKYKEVIWKYNQNGDRVRDADSEKSGRKYVANVNPNDQDLAGQLRQIQGYTWSPSSTFLTQLLTGLVPFFIVIALIWLLISRQVKSAGGGAMSFAKSKAKLLSKDSHKVTFEDVAGVEEAKEELVEIIGFLKDPKRFQRLGGRIPKGVLLVGPPGTGKTLLAKSVAGEANVPFFTISGSDFVEMFVGVGAARVRDMFEQAKKSAPCIIFMDEIDAVGRYRGAGIGGGHDEREQTLNQLLAEMDGFDTQEGVVLMAATNRPDVLDPALLRSGRFDRQIVIDLPDLVGREQILKLHARKVKLDASVDLNTIARGTPGFSGADLANLINEAALLAAKLDKEAVTRADLEEARDKVRWGRERRSRTLSEEERKITAYHEAGHALVLDRLDETEPLHKVTIVPRGVAFLGATMQLPEKDKYLHKKKELLGQITGMLAGRVAEEMVFDDVTSGAASDFKQATKIARAMVCELGMSEKLGTMTFGEREEMIFLGKEIARHSEYSEATAVDIDKEVRSIIEACRERAKAIVTQYKDKLEAIATALLEYEVLEGKEITEIIEGTWRPRPRHVAKSAGEEREQRVPEKSEKPAGLRKPGRRAEDRKADVPATGVVHKRPE
jgi:cell division protease FtsH